MGLGIAVHPGLPLPDLTTARTVREALLSATRVAFIDPKGGGTSGPFIAKLFAHATRTVVTASTFALALSAVGCGNDDMNPDIVLIDRTTSALSFGTLNALNGSYGAGCIGKSGSWSSPIGACTATRSCGARRRACRSRTR